MKKKRLPDHIMPTSHMMTGKIYFPDFGDKDTPEDNEAFYKAHFVNAGKVFKRNKSPLEAIKEFIERLKRMKILLTAYLVSPPIISAAALLSAPYSVYGHGLFVDWVILTAVIYFSAPALFGLLWSIARITATVHDERMKNGNDND